MRLCTVVYQNIRMVTHQVSVHHRHSELMTYSDCDISHMQKTAPARVPMFRPIQYQAR